MKTSQKGIDLIKAHEGFRAHAYADPGSGGEPFTVGYGTTHGVHPNTVVTEQEAHDMLVAELAVYENAVNHGVKIEITQGIFDALVDFCYNVGPRNFLGSTVLRRLNASDIEGAANALLMWNKASGHIMAGLVRRRQDERDLFLA